MLCKLLSTARDIIFSKCEALTTCYVLCLMSPLTNFHSISLQTKEGLQNALETTDLMVRAANVTLHAAATGEDISNRITIPQLIGDPNVPAALVKNPSRTVKISQLTSQISSIDVVAALESWGKNVTGFFFGKLDSVAFVEFEVSITLELQFVLGHIPCSR